MFGLCTAVRFQDRSAVYVTPTLDEDHGVDKGDHGFFVGVGNLGIRRDLHHPAHCVDILCRAVL